MTDKAAIMNEMRLRVADKICSIEDMVKKEYGLTSITKYTLIARDPKAPEMYIVISNEDTSDFVDVARLVEAEGWKPYSKPGKPAKDVT